MGGRPVATMKLGPGDSSHPPTTKGGTPEGRPFRIIDSARVRERRPAPGASTMNARRGAALGPRAVPQCDVTLRDDVPYAICCLV